MPMICNRLSFASAVNSSASSWQGTHQDAQTLTTETLPLKAAGSSPGTGTPLWTRPSNAGSAGGEAARPMWRAGSSDVRRLAAGAPGHAAGLEFAQARLLEAMIDGDPDDEKHHDRRHQRVGR